jgi:hypothetical protein
MSAKLALEHIYITSPHASNDEITIRVNKPFLKLSKLYG